MAKWLFQIKASHLEDWIESVALDHFGLVLDAVGRDSDDFNVQERTAGRRVGRAEVLAGNERQVHVEDVKAVKLFAPRIEAAVHDVGSIPHQGRFEDEPAPAHLFEEGRVEMERCVLRLVVERHHLNAKGPKEDRIKVGRVDPHARRVGAQELRFRVVQNRSRLLSAQLLGRRFVDGAALEDGVAPLARECRRGLRGRR